MISALSGQKVVLFEEGGQKVVSFGEGGQDEQRKKGNILKELWFLRLTG